jgi:hypothetical protein
MKRMRNNNKTQIITGRRGTMPPPSEFRVGGDARFSSGRVGRQRGAIWAGPFRRPPAKPDMILS